MTSVNENRDENEDEIMEVNEENIEDESMGNALCSNQNTDPSPGTSQNNQSSSNSLHSTLHHTDTPTCSKYKYQKTGQVGSLPESIKKSSMAIFNLSSTNHLEKDNKRQSPNHSVTNQEALSNQISNQFVAEKSPLNHKSIILYVCHHCWDKIINFDPGEVETSTNQLDMQNEDKPPKQSVENLMKSMIGIGPCDMCLKGEYIMSSNDNFEVRVNSNHSANHLEMQNIDQSSVHSASNKSISTIKNENPMDANESSTKTNSNPSTSHLENQNTNQLRKSNTSTLCEVSNNKLVKHSIEDHIRSDESLNISSCSECWNKGYRMVTNENVGKEKHLQKRKSKAKSKTSNSLEINDDDAENMSMEQPPVQPEPLAPDELLDVVMSQQRRRGRTSAVRRRPTTMRRKISKKRGIRRVNKNSRRHSTRSQDRENIRGTPTMQYKVHKTVCNCGKPAPRKRRRN